MTLRDDNNSKDKFAVGLEETAVLRQVSVSTSTKLIVYALRLFALAAVGFAIYLFAQSKFFTIGFNPTLGAAAVIGISLLATTAFAISFHSLLTERRTIRISKAQLKDIQHQINQAKVLLHSDAPESFVAGIRRRAP